MNQEQLDVLFQSTDIHDEFLNELDNLLNSTLKGNKQFIKLLIKLLNNLQNFDETEIINVDSNEKLKQCNFNCYSLHLKGKGFNIRILATRKNSKWLLLTIFNEQSGKKKSSYAKYIPIAEKRLNN